MRNSIELIGLIKLILFKNYRNYKSKKIKRCSLKTSSSRGKSRFHVIPCSHIDLNLVFLPTLYCSFPCSTLMQVTSPLNIFFFLPFFLSPPLRQFLLESADPRCCPSPTRPAQYNCTGPCCRSGVLALHNFTPRHHDHQPRFRPGHPSV